MEGWTGLFCSVDTFGMRVASLGFFLWTCVRISTETPSNRNRSDMQRSHRNNAVREIVDPHQKALDVNLDPRRYGTFAEIGAGQEVVRWFFRVGGGAGTIAKSISAYDMKVSDAIYGRASRCCTENPKPFAGLTLSLSFRYSVTFMVHLRKRYNTCLIFASSTFR